MALGNLKYSVIRRLILLLLFTGFNSTAYNQVIKGTIRDQITGNVIGYASVYFNGTFAGTLTDNAGNFELDISKFSTKPLTVSALGYFSVTLTNPDSIKAPVIYLTPKFFELNEVVISAKKISAARRTNLKIFKREFLGTTMNSNNCIILNEEDIIFSSDISGDTLIAFALKPILVENNALGYKLSYYLDIFKFNKHTSYMLLTGNCIFYEDQNSAEIQKQKYDSRRRNTYNGSRMHFFRSLWENNLITAGFDIKDDKYKQLQYDKIVTESLSAGEGILNKYLCAEGRIRITFHNLRFPFESTMIINKKYVYFDQSGFFDPFGITWQGEMSRHRVADMLPSEYNAN
jgi:hypothetical protein